jgi:HAD superfamily hydrolase (TIGR01490 family)
MPGNVAELLQSVKPQTLAHTRDIAIAPRRARGHGGAMQPLSIYDMDKTITRRATMPGWLTGWLLHEAPWRVLLAPAMVACAAAYAVGLLSRTRFKELIQALVMGRSVSAARVAARAERFVAAQIADNLRADALAQIASDRADGRRIVMATASNTFYADAIGAALGIDDVIATRVRRAGDQLLAVIDGENCYGAAKLRMVDAWLAQHGLTGAPIRFYSDHVSDAPMLERAAEPVAANPSAPLRALARQRGWPIVDWR